MVGGSRRSCQREGWAPGSPCASRSNSRHPGNRCFGVRLDRGVATGAQHVAFVIRRSEALRRRPATSDRRNRSSRRRSQPQPGFARGQRVDDRGSRTRGRSSHHGARAVRRRAETHPPPRPETGLLESSPQTPAVKNIPPLTSSLATGHPQQHGQFPGQRALAAAGHTGDEDRTGLRHYRTPPTHPRAPSDRMASPGRAARPIRRRQAVSAPEDTAGFRRSLWCRATRGGVEVVAASQAGSHRSPNAHGAGRQRLINASRKTPNAAQVAAAWIQLSVK